MFMRVAGIICAVGLSALAAGPSYGSARAAGILRGPAARRATSAALLSFVKQFQKVQTIRLNAWVRHGHKPLILKNIKYARLLGRYQFWADGQKYRIDWQIIRSNYDPLVHEIWTFDGHRYEASTGVPKTLIAIYHKRPIGFFGPGQGNVLFAPIRFLCNRHTPRQPGNWLDWWRVRRHPHQVADLGKNRVIHWFKYTSTGAKFVFSIRNPFLRYPARWGGKAAASVGVKPGRYVRYEMVLRRRGHVYLPVDQFPLPAIRSTGGIKWDRRFTYQTVKVGSGRIYLLKGEKIFKRGKWRQRIDVVKLTVDSGIDAARFTINYDLAPGYYERGRIVGLSRGPAAPARTQHLGGTKENGESSNH